MNVERKTWSSRMLNNVCCRDGGWLPEKQALIRNLQGVSRIIHENAAVSR